MVNNLEKISMRMICGGKISLTTPWKIIKPWIIQTVYTTVYLILSR